MLFDRKKYKSFAKMQLKGRWTVPVLMTLIVTVIMSLFDIPSVIRLFNSPEFTSIMVDSTSFGESITLMREASHSAEGTPVFTLIQLLVDSIFGMAALSVYLRMSRSPEKVSLSYFIESLNLWWRAILAFLWQYLWTFLWSLLFIIPGIVKAIAYSQTNYLVCEYKNLSIQKAMKISIAITKGHKADIFVTYLSFIGWGFLCALSMGIGFLWLEPYMNMTLTNVYHALLKDALETGVITGEDLA